MMGNHVSKLYLPYNFEENLTIRLIENEFELESALQLLYESYTEYDYMLPNEHELRLSIYHVLPATITAIALIDNKIIGTVSFIQDGPFQLPSDQIFDNGILRSKFERIYEISGLAISKKYRGESGKYLYMLIKFVINYSRIHLQSDCIVALVNPRQTFLYENILLFEKIPNTIISEYKFAKNAPAIALYLNLVKLKDTYNQYYGAIKSEKENFYHFMFKVIHPQLIFPKGEPHINTNPLLPPDFIKKYFIEKTNIINDLTESKLRSFLNHYKFKEYSEIFALFLKRINYQEKIDPRYQIVLEAYLYKKDSALSYVVDVLNVSVSGVMFNLPINSHMDDSEYKLCFKFSKESIMELKIKLSWQKEKLCGVSILGKNLKWEKKINEIKKHYLKIVA